MAKLGVELSPFPDGDPDETGGRKTLGPFWRFPFPGIPVPYMIRRVWEQKGFIEAAMGNRAPAQLPRIKVDPGIRGGIRNFHIHLGNEVLILDAQTFELLARAAAAEVLQQKEANVISW